MSKFHKSDELGRRQFMLNAARCYLGVTLPPLLGGSMSNSAWAAPKLPAGGSAEHVIYLNMAGGMSHIDTFDTKPKKKAVQGPVETIASSADGITLSEYLPKTAQVMHHACVINSMTSKQGAHEQGQYLIHRSYSKRGTIIHPSMGAWVTNVKGRLNEDIPGFVSIGGSPDQASAGFLGARYAGVPLGRPDEGLKNCSLPDTVNPEDFQRRLALADALNRDFHNQYPHASVTEYDDLYQEAVRLMQSKDLKAFDLSKEKEGVKARYGNNHFGQGCLLARRLVEHGVRYVEVTLGGWDTHYDNFTSVAARCHILDAAYAALIQDLHSRGLLAKTLVVLTSEFGRSPEIKPDQKNGRDHHPTAFSTVLAGGGIKQGYLHGKTDSKGMRVKKDPVTPADLNATIAQSLGISTERRHLSPSGRPFTISNKGQPIMKLLS